MQTKEADYSDCLLTVFSLDQAVLNSAFSYSEVCRAGMKPLDMTAGCVASYFRLRMHNK